MPSVSEFNPFAPKRSRTHTRSTQRYVARPRSAKYQGGASSSLVVMKVSVCFDSHRGYFLQRLVWGYEMNRPTPEMPLAFGVDIRYYRGAPLLRQEGKIAFEALPKRLTHIRLAPEKNDLTHTASFVLRGLKAVSVKFEKA